MSKRPAVARLGLLALAASLSGLIVAPFLMPADYSLLADTVSKAAGQGVAHGWITKTAFVLSGVAALCFALVSWPRWGRLGAAAHVVFAALMCAAAWFETRPWRADAAFDPVEHDRHSDASNIAAAVFALCIAVVLYAERPVARWRLALGVSAIVASGATPIIMTVYSNVDGLLERAWFVVAFGWWIATGLLLARESAPRASDPAAPNRPTGA